MPRTMTKRGRLAAIHERDLRLFRRVALHHSARGDLVLPKLSRAADHSLLWLACSGLLWLSRSRMGRRAALRGLISLTMTSVSVNGPVKWIARRNRPLIDDVPEIRRSRRLPKSSSFPSGHSASAFAFATGVAIEKPLLGLAFVPLASAVAASRVYVGVHYPSDVVAGAALGALLASSTALVWPRAPAQPPVVKRAARPGIAISTGGKGLLIVVNAAAGDGGSASAELRSAFPDADIVEAEPEDLRTVLEDRLSDHVVVGISGGDGSINTAAQVAVDAGVPLAVLPAGTLNHLARDLGLSDLGSGIEAIAGGSCATMDVATIDGHVFVNTASLGSYVELVDAREKLEKRVGKWPAVLLALLRVLRRSEPVDLEIDGVMSKVWMVFVGNCRYHPSGFAPTWRADLADGNLDIRIVEASRPFARTRVILSALTGRLGRSRVLQQRTAASLRVRSPDGPLRLSRDGETFEASSAEFEIAKHPRRLTVLVPGDDRDRFK